MYVHVKGRLGNELSTIKFKVEHQVELNAIKRKMIYSQIGVGINFIKNVYVNGVTRAHTVRCVASH